MAITLMFTLANVPVSATSTYKKQVEVEDSKEMYSKIKEMTTKELNELIDEAYKQSITSDSTSKTTAISATSDAIKLAWIAAGEIAIRNGYECAGTLVQYSVQGTDYSETNSGMFIDKIKDSSDYKSYMQSISNPINPQTGSFVFTQGDLFYALHKVDIFTYAGYPYYKSVITDVFNFDLDNYMGNLFTTLVNNWAWLCQQTYILTPINVTITIYN